MCMTYLFQMWGFFIHAWCLHILRGCITEFTTSFVWFKFGHLQLDTLLKALLKHEKDKHYGSENYICYFASICRLVKHKSTKVYVSDREWDFSYFKVTTTNCSKRMHYNHLYWHLFPFTISIQLAFLVVFCSIYKYYFCSQICLHQQNILRITCFYFTNCWSY